MKNTIIALALLLSAAPTLATDGYFSHGYGMQAKGRGGASTAYHDNAFGGANNPASMAFVGNRLDLGVDIFSPQRGASRSGFGPGLDGSVQSDSTAFAIPEFAYNHAASDRLALGVTVYGNGGMNTDYPGGQQNCGGGPANLLCGVGSLGVDLSQLIVAPNLAFKFSDSQAIGFAPLLAYQRFKAKGLQAFAGTPGLSANPGAVTNNGYDSSTGAGLRIGYYAELSPAFSVGLAYATRIKMGEFDKYAGLFAERGDFDIPENYNLGFKWIAAPGLTIGTDYQKINYSKVNSIGNQSLVPAQLGSVHGPGFGWKNVSVIKIGVDYAPNERWAVRAGYNHCDNPITPANVTFNILAPGVVQSHVTLGATRHLTSHSELTFAYMHAFNGSVSGPSILPVFSGGQPFGVERIQMHQNSLGLAWGRHY